MNAVSVQCALIVDGLSLSMRSEDLKELFMPFGTVVWARVVRDRFEQSLMYGYVVMETEAQAAKAIEGLHGKVTGNRKLLVDHTAMPPLPRRA
jgi:RNA recognition motif-containing protein